MLSRHFSFGLLVGSAAAVARTSPSSLDKVVAKSGGQYTTIQAAIDSIDKKSSAATTIFVTPGTYSEQVNISGHAGHIRIYGFTHEDQDYAENTVIVTNKLAAIETGNNANSGTIIIESSKVSLYNLRVENTAGDVGPAHALTARENHLGFYGCAFIGYQDTVFVDGGSQVFKNSYIEGAVDYIYGPGNIWMENVTIGYTREDKGYITASGRDSDDASWYVIHNSSVRPAPGIKVRENSVLLGRAWRPFARVVFQNSDLDKIVAKEGWGLWDGSDLDPKNIFYGEFNNTGAGADISGRAPWTRQLLSALSMHETMPGWTEWVDRHYWDGKAHSDA